MTCKVDLLKLLAGVVADAESQTLLKTADSVYSGSYAAVERLTKMPFPVTNPNVRCDCGP